MRPLRHHLAALLDVTTDTLPARRVTYDLRRLRLDGLVMRTPGTQRYRPTDAGLRTALFCSRVYLRVLRPGLTTVLAPSRPADGAGAAGRLQQSLGTGLIRRDGCAGPPLRIPKPAAEHHAPWPFALAQWLPQATIDDLVREAGPGCAAQRAGGTRGTAASAPAPS